MKRKMFVPKVDNFEKQKKLYLLLIGLAVLSVIAGIVFIFLIDKDSTSLINDKIRDYFSNGNKDYTDLFFKSLFNSFIYIIIIWLFGISIFGLVISISIMLFKSFLFGFSFISIISTYGFKGLLIALIHMFPHQIVYLIILILMSFYASNLSIKLFKHLFMKKPISFKESMNKYFRVLLISLVASLLVSLYDGYVSNFLLNLFI